MDVTPLEAYNAAIHNPNPNPNPNPLEAYNAAIYWSLVTMTSVGFGDIVPVTAGERVMTSIVILITACLFAFLLGSVTSLVGALDVQEQEYFKLRDSLNEFTVAEDIPKALCYKLRRYLRNRHHQGNLFDWSKVLNCLSPQLREEIAASVQAKYLKTNMYFSDVSDEVLAAIANRIIQRTYVKGELMIQANDPPNCMYVIRQGRVISRGRVYGEGSLIGEDMLYFASTKAFHSLADIEPRAKHEMREGEMSLFERMERKVVDGAKKRSELLKEKKRNGYPDLRDYKVLV